jgi:hypothetical protein
VDRLEAVLDSVLRASGSIAGVRSIVRHETNVFESTFKSEIVRCELGDGTTLYLLCKRGAGHVDDVYDHKGGVPYEALVYQHILQPLQVTVPTFYGAIKDHPSGETWLILEYLPEGMRVSKMPHPDAMSMAASWIGQFHATSEARLHELPRTLLKAYDADYYLGWARRTLLFADALPTPFYWLRGVCDGYEHRLASLMKARPSVVHGEFTPHNVLMSGGTIFPVDWESAALGAGEIDLAILTDSWPASLTEACKLAYQRARWPGGRPSDFEESLATARLYCQFRWLGARPEWTTDQRAHWRFAQLRSLGQELGLS